MTEIIELIDNAIWDATTSPDAMRWTPEQPTEGEATTSEWLDVLGDVIRRMDQVALMPPVRIAEPRRRVVEEHRDGSRLVPFIGGPRDGDLLRLPMDPGYAWNVMDPPSLIFRPETDLFDEIGYSTYTVRRVWASVGAMPDLGLYAAWRGLASVCVIGECDDTALNGALLDALCAGWRPWLYDPAVTGPVAEDRPLGLT